MNNPYYTECPVKDVLSVKSLYTFFRKQIPRDYNFKGESHDFHEILCVMSGEVGVTADKNVYRPAGRSGDFSPRRRISFAVVRPRHIAGNHRVFFCRRRLSAKRQTHLHPFGAAAFGNLFRFRRGAEGVRTGKRARGSRPRRQRSGSFRRGEAAGNYLYCRCLRKRRKRDS